MSFFGRNIKKIRTFKKLSQSAFADLFSLTRASVGAYEEGRAEAKIETCQQIANYFGISLDQLLTKDLTINELAHFEPTKHFSAESPKSLEFAVKQNHIGIVYHKAVSEYLTNRLNESYINTLPEIKVPISCQQTVRAFEIFGNDMQINEQGLFSGDLLLTEKVENLDWKLVHPNKVYVIVSRTDIIVRRVTQITDFYTLSADNLNVEPMQLNFSEIVEVWKVVGFYSSRLRQPSTLEERVERIEKQLERMGKKQ